MKNKKVGTIVVGGSPVDSIQYELIDKQFDCMAKYLSWDLLFQGKPIDFKLADDWGYSIMQENMYQHYYGERCQTCGMKMICNGCSRCEKCS